MRRQATIDEALDHAERIVAERGACAVTIAEIARQMGMRHRRSTSTSSGVTLP